MMMMKDKKMIGDMMNYAKGLSCPRAHLLDEDAVEEYLHIDDAPVTLQLTDSEICDMVMNENIDTENDDDNEDGATIEEQITIDRMISLTEEMTHGMEQRNFATEHHVMSLYKIHEFLIKERPKISKTT
jgi:hypothetical protein